MLAARNRLTSPDQFREVVRRGHRAGGPLLVVHLLERRSHAPDGAPRAGLVVSKAVGTAVTRNLVKRRLRHLLRFRLSLLPEGAMLVVRALPAAASAEYDELADELDRCLRKGLGRLEGHPAQVSHSR